MVTGSRTTSGPGRKPESTSSSPWSFPIPDRGIPTRQTAALDLARSLASEAEDGKRVVVHCRQGIGRSGIIAAATLVALGRRPDEALVEVERARGRPVPDTEEQRDWVLALNPRGAD